MRKFALLLVAVALLFATAASVVPSRAQDKPTKTIADIVVESASAKDKPEFTVLLAAVKAADPIFLNLLSAKDANMTVFAPTDAAFGDLLKALNVKAEDLLKNKALLNVVLAYHVVPAVGLDAAAVTAAKGAIVGTALPDNALKINVDGGKVKINDSTVVKADVKAVNGIVHVVDKVLVPEDYAKLAEAAGVPAGTPAANAAKPVSIAETVVAASTAAKPEFTVLLAAVKAADPAVLKTLSGAGSYTVFAPTDAAFVAALKALNVTADKLLADKNLTNILLYHVAPGQLSSKAVVKYAGKDGVKLVTLLPGAALTIKVDGGSVLIDKAKVATPDVPATNGIIHVIDGVLLPPTK